VPDFQIPEDVNALDDSALAEALASALAEAAEFSEIPDADLTDEHLERLQALADFATTAREQAETRQVAASERADRIAAARATLAPPAEPEIVEAEIVEEEPVKAEVKEPVAAAAKRPVVARAAAAKAATPVEVEVFKPAPMLTASADVPGFTTGGQLDDLDSVGKAMVARMKALPTGRVGGERGTRNRYSVAKLDLAQTRTEGLTQTSFDSDQALITKARDEKRLDGGALTAAGGWCAPSETLYDLCSISSTDGLLDLPTVNVSRGGIRFTKGGSFADLYNNPDLGWWLTEAQVIAEEEKPCIEIECPPFEEVRLDAVGLCVRVPLLTQAAYPELVRWTIENALIAHQHIVDAALINQIVAGSSDLDVDGTFETTIDSIAKIEQAANWIRQSWRMSFNETLEVLAPYWYRTTMRADLARRTGVDLINVTDATLDGYFTARGVRIQWLYNYQPLAGGPAGQTPGPVETPDEAQIVIYPAGAWVKGTTDVITLDAVYDSQSLAVNTYTALFTEEGVLTANTCFDSYLLTLPTCGSGRTGAADLTSCVLGAPAAP
jgi:hypothetical protein